MTERLTENGNIKDPSTAPQGPSNSKGTTRTEAVTTTKNVLELPQVVVSKTASLAFSTTGIQY
jgi:hypothetical protein